MTSSRSSKRPSAPTAALHIAFQQRRQRGPVRPAHHPADGRALSSGLRHQHPGRVAVDEARKSRPYFGPVVVPSSIIPPSAGTSAFPARPFTSPASSPSSASPRRLRWNSPSKASASTVSLPAQSRPKCSTAPSAKAKPTQRKRWRHKTRLGASAPPEEIASAVLWLSSPGAAFTTG